MAWEWLAPAGTAFGAAVGALAVVVSGRVTSRAEVRGQEVQLELLKLQVATEDRRALLAAKQVLYAKFLTEIEGLQTAALALRRSQTESVEARRAAHEKVDDIHDRLMGLESELLVLAGTELYTISSRTITVILKFATGSVPSTSKARSDLVGALHADITSH
ncbi:hypothetical protein AB0F90_11270 [Micromonospora chalcea]|uniref:hypothetical protein n=1 Tax=Micromonospora chalcea TaxID=1874 RepID=UPI0033C50F39